MSLPPSVHSEDSHLNRETPISNTSVPTQIPPVFVLPSREPSVVEPLLLPCGREGEVVSFEQPQTVGNQENNTPGADSFPVFPSENPMAYLSFVPSRNQLQFEDRDRLEISRHSPNFAVNCQGEFQ